ncbi:putative transporter ygaY [Neofusicoccum parvum]|nr:putative transporter ygaY [Neofusicoccum parvum]
MGLNFLFAFAGAFTVANLYYNHPILNILADDFNVTIGLCITTSLPVFSALSFIVGATTVTPQLMLPLVGELAPPNKKGVSLSIVTSGLMLGILIARLLSGTITEYVSWRDVYWMALGLQYLMALLVFAFMPDYPSTNPTKNLNYFKLLWSIITLLFKQPTLMQSCLISLFTSATFTNFWTTLTFLLAGPPYHLSPLIIGLFALIGIGAMVFGPLYARLITDRFVPWFSVVLGELIALTGIVVGTYTGTFTLAGPVIQAFLFDLGFQSAQVANRAAIYAIAPRARNRVNTAFMVFTFCGQLMGTAVGSSVYVRSGWVASGSVSVGFVCVSLLFCAVRGPWEKGWLGWSGGWGIRQKPMEEVSGQGQGAAQRDEEKALGEVAGEDVSRKEGMKVRGEDEIVRDLESDAEKQSRRSEKSIPEDGDDGPKTEKI